jgi:GWxTD domain-containing protein
MIRTSIIALALAAAACCLSNPMLAAPFAVFNHKVFYLPGNGNMVETYLDFQGSSVVLKEVGSGKYQAQVEIILIFRKVDEIINFGKKVVNSPIMTPSEPSDFLDMQRFTLPNGEYTLEISLRDMEATENAVAQIEIDLSIQMPEKGAYFSDVALVQAYKKTTEPNEFSRSGYDLLPMVSDDFLNPDMQEVVFYGELYGITEAVEGEMFLLAAHFETANGAVVEGTRKMERRKADAVVPFLYRIPLEPLKSGEYHLVVEARNRNNEVMATGKHYVKRLATRPVNMNLDVSPEKVATSWVGRRFENKFELHEHIKSLRPISDDREIFTAENTLKDPNAVELALLQQYFYAFWEARDYNDSEGAWIAYREKVLFADQQFSTRNKRGYETDRGRVYLKYGPPVDIVDRANEPNSYPYQIWRYYKADKWNNVRFVFYDRKLTRTDYELLHCEYIPGELMTPQWRVMLQQRTTPVIGVDDRDSQQHYGGRVDDFFDNPR